MTKHVHMIGIGGAGMSAVASILIRRGIEVTGSDIKAGAVTERLESLGAQVFIGHRASNVGKPDVVVYSSAISASNPEMLIARERGIELVHRSKMLARMAEDREVVAVTGMHGKTTTTYITAALFLSGGLEPSVAVGAEVSEFSGNAIDGRGRYFILEADESDRSFLNFSPKYSIITNIENEHMDCYGDLNEIISTFRRFIDRTAPEGALFLCGEDINTQRAIGSYSGRRINYGLSGKFDISAEKLEMDKGSSEFDIIYFGKSLGRVNLSLPGRHNILNSLAALGAALEAGIEFDVAREALGNLTGVERRFQVRGCIEDILVIEDYAHHPTEIRATVSCARTVSESSRPIRRMGAPRVFGSDSQTRRLNRRIVAVFQPHRYTRTKYLLNDFGTAFEGAGQVIITDIYSAGEAPIEGASGENISRQVERNGQRDVIFLHKEEVLGHLLEILRPGDLVLIMGAGDIGNVATELVARLREKMGPSLFFRHSFLREK